MLAETRVSVVCSERPETVEAGRYSDSSDGDVSSTGLARVRVHADGQNDVRWIRTRRSRHVSGTDSMQPT